MADNGPDHGHVGRTWERFGAHSRRRRGRFDFERAIADLPAELRGARPPGLPHTPWRLVEHMRIA